MRSMLRTPQPHRESSTINPTNVERDGVSDSVRAVPSGTADWHMPSALAQYGFDPVAVLQPVRGDEVVCERLVVQGGRLHAAADVVRIPDLNF